MVLVDQHAQPQLRKRKSLVAYSPQPRKVIRWRDPQVQLAFLRSCYSNKVHVVTDVPVLVKWQIVASELSDSGLFPPHTNTKTYRIRLAHFLQDFLAEEGQRSQPRQQQPSECDSLLRKMTHRDGDGNGVASSVEEILGDSLDEVMSLDDEDSSGQQQQQQDPLVLLEVLATIRQAALHRLVDSEEHDDCWQAAADALLHNPRCHDLPRPFDGCQLRQLYLTLRQQLLDGDGDGDEGLDPADGVAWTRVLKEMHEESSQVEIDSNRSAREEREDWMECPAVVCSSLSIERNDGDGLLPEEAAAISERAAEREKWVALLKESRLRTAALQAGKVEIKALLQETRTLCLDALVACHQAMLTPSLGNAHHEDS
eukprot:gene9788-10824_t